MKQSLSPDMVEHMSQQLGASPEQTGKAASSAMSVLLSALARNASTPSGASSLNNALEKDNHGSILDMLGGALGGGNSSSSSAGGGLAGALGSLLGGQSAGGNAGSGLGGALGGLLTGMLSGGGNNRAANGAGILKHILGRRAEDTASQIGQESGLGTGNTLKLMSMLAPIVMGMLGKTKQQGQLNADGLGGLLDGFMRKNVQPSRPSAETNLGLAGRLLDRDGDGSAIDDIAGMIGGFLSKR